MNIIPNGTVTLYENIPLQNDYKITYWFDTLAHQTSYFNNQTKIELFPSGEPTYRGKFSYIRRNKNRLKIEVNMNKIINCNYMSFKNIDTSGHTFEEKTFYCFVEDVIYINNTTTEIVFSIDLMQTYLFDIHLKQCFIVRQHEEHDDMYANLQPEQLSTGDYVSENIEPYIPFYGTTSPFGGDFSIVLAYNPKILTDIILHTLWGDDTYQTYHRPMQLYGSIYQGCEFLIFPMYKQVMDKFRLLLGGMKIETLNGIVGLYIIPSFAVPIQFDPTTETQAEYEGRQQNHEISNWHLYDEEADIIRKNNSFNGYTPFNKKLYTYPYCYLYATNFRGNTEIYKYEYFTYPVGSEEISFSVEGNFSLQPSLMLRPINYKNTSVSDDNLFLANLPSCSWNSSELVDWMAKTAMISIGSYSAGGSISEYARMGGVSTYQGGYKENKKIPVYDATTETLPSTNVQRGNGFNLANDMLSGAKPAYYDNETENIYNRNGYYASFPLVFGEQMQGSPTTDIQFGNNLMKTFGIYKMQIKREYAERIDNFFTMYGYAQNKLAVPNIHARSNWTYIQTANCYLTGENMQFNQEKAIEDIFNKGITFWAYNGMSPIGDYSNPSNNTELG